MNKYFKNYSSNIFSLILTLSIALIPLTALAGASNNNQHMQLQTASYYSGWVWDSSTRWRAYAYVTENTDGTFYVQTYRQCYRNNGLCNWYDMDRCIVYNAGKEIVLVANKSHVIIDLQPGDCDDTLGSPIGSQLSWEANGREESSNKYDTYSNRYEGPNGEQCMSKSNDGLYEKRSADVSGTIEGDVIMGERDIETRTTGHWIQNCSN